MGKRNNYQSLQNRVNKVAYYLNNMKVETAQDVYFANGMEKALSIIENRPPSYRKYKRNSLKQKIRSSLLLLQLKALYFGGIAIDKFKEKKI
ncbi:hypothetical protein ACH0BF_02235 [Pseudobacillus sp. 179-B 2D1 NHS]|uniref:hypothetical protein n=1 Tax=Pseudobacillus sp. 179-B 2D1 NHS TaxID=3374292 RepID=UPI003879DD9C